MPVPELSHNKICNLEDFSHPDLYPVIREVFAHEVARFGDAFPLGRENRKDWEAAMAIRAFAAHGLLDGRSEFLGVAAGNEPLVFHLTRFARRVFATDLYLASGDWEPFGHESMMTDPYQHWPFAWNPRRLVVQHMDALDLQYEDETFDGVFSGSSIEHFGGHPEVERSMDEMFRVLRPGGVCAVSTEFRLAGPSPGLPGCLLFDADELASRLIGDRAWHLVSPLDLSVSDATVGSKTDVADVVAQQLAQCDRDGGWFTHKLDYRHFPHIVMGIDDFVFTSIQLALQKDEAPGGAPSSSRDRERSRLSTPLTGTHAVALDQAPFSGAGWYAPHHSPSGAARWTGPGRDASIDLQILVSPRTTVEVLVVAAVSPSVLEDLRVEVNGLPISVERVTHDEGTLVRGVVPASYASVRPFTRISLRTPQPPAPFAEGEDRVGVAVRWVRLIAPRTP